MGTVLASALIARTRILMKDRSAIAQRYTDAEYLDMLNEGQVAVVRLAPYASTKTVPVTITGTATEHTIPTDGVLYVRVHANSENGLSIVPTTIESLDASDPLWRTTVTAGANIPRQSAADTNNPYKYFITPAGLTDVLLQYSFLPASVPAVSSPITLNDVYQSALVYYMSYKALEPDSDNPNNKTLSDDYFQKFNLSVTGATPGATNTS
jgi:hypothetical protein